MARFLSRPLWRFFVDLRALGLWIYFSYWWVAPLFFRRFPVPFENSPFWLWSVLSLPTNLLYFLWDGGYDSLAGVTIEQFQLPGLAALLLFYYLFSVGSVVAGTLVGSYCEAETSGIRWVAIGACFLLGGLLFLEPVIEAAAYTPTTPIVEVGAGLLALFAGSALLAMDRAVARYRTV